MKLEKWGEIIQKLTDKDHTVVLIDSSKHSLIYDQFIDRMNLPGNKVINLSNKSTSLKMSIAMLALSDGVIGVDSSFMHLGTALGKPTYGIFGAFRGQLRMGYYKKAKWYDVQKGECECNKVPCFLHETNIGKCLYTLNNQPAECLRNVDANRIASEFHELVMMNNE